MQKKPRGMTGPKKLYRGVLTTPIPIKLTAVGAEILDDERKRAGTETQPMSRGDFVEHLLRTHAKDVPDRLLDQAFDEDKQALAQ